MIEEEGVWRQYPWDNQFWLIIIRGNQPTMINSSLILAASSKGNEHRIYNSCDYKTYQRTCSPCPGCLAARRSLWSWRYVASFEGTSSSPRLSSASPCNAARHGGALWPAEPQWLSCHYDNGTQVELFFYLEADTSILAATHLALRSSKVNGTWQTTPPLWEGT